MKTKALFLVVPVVFGSTFASADMTSKQVKMWIQGEMDKFSKPFRMKDTEKAKMILGNMMSPDFMQSGKGMMGGKDDVLKSLDMYQEMTSKYDSFKLWVSGVKVKGDMAWAMEGCDVKGWTMDPKTHKNVSLKVKQRWNATYKMADGKWWITKWQYTTNDTWVNGKLWMGK